MCSHHYHKAWREGRLADHPLDPPWRPTECAVDGCSLPAKARGWCNRHYQNWRARGDPLTRRERGAKCAVCLHPRQDQIEVAMLAGMTTSEVCRIWGISESSRHLHRSHMGVPSRNAIQCRTCLHPDVEHLDELLIAGERGAVATVARIVGVTSGAVSQHKRLHLNDPLAAEAVAAYQVQRLHAIKSWADEHTA